MNSHKATHFWILANQHNIEGRDKQEVYQDYTQGVDSPLTKQALAVRVKAVLGLTPQYKNNGYPYQPIDLELILPEKEELVNQEVQDVTYYIQELNPTIDFSQQELNAILFNQMGLQYKQFKEKGRSIYRYVESDLPHPLQQTN